MMIRSYRDLYIYQEAYRLGVEAHQFSLKLPKYELYELGSQLRRASKSVSLNLVEGHGRRRYPLEYLRYLIFSHASCDESGECLRYLSELYPEIQFEGTSLKQRYEILSRRINRTLLSLKKGNQDA